MTTVALVGASGFVGRQAYRALTAEGAVVVPVRAPRIEHSESSTLGVIREMYPETIDGLARAFSGADVVINAAGDPDASSNDVVRLQGANAVLPGLIGLASTRARVSRLIQVSSAAVQGRRPCLDDSLETEAFSDYSRSKAAGEILALESAARITTIYRPPSVHAPDRRVTRTLTKLATSSGSTVAGEGRPTPQALGDNVGSAIAFLALTDRRPPQVVAHPSEGLTTRSLLELLGGRAPRSIPVPLARFALLVATRLEWVHPSVAANARRVEMVWFGQDQAPSWLTTAGWTPSIGPDGWSALGRQVRATCDEHTQRDMPDSATTSRPKILFGVTTGIVVKSFFSGQFAMLKEAGWEVTLVTTDRGDARQVAEDEGAALVPINAVRDPSPREDMRTLLSLVRQLRRERPTLAVWGTPKFGLLGPIASRLTRTPSVYVLHGLRLQTATGLHRVLLLWLERAACFAADDVVAVSHDLRAEAIRLRLTNSRHIRVLGAGSANGVEFRPRSPHSRSALSLPQDGAIVSFVGRITRDKGIVELLLAWPRVHADTGATLALAGMKEPDAHREPISQLLAETPGIVELGHLDNLVDLYTATDILVLPSYREGYPTVVLEAASYGAPAVVTDATGLRESVIHGQTGLVVAIGDVNALADALRSLISDHEKCRRLGKGALENSRQYERGNVHQNWLKYFDWHRNGRVGQPPASITRHVGRLNHPTHPEGS